MEGSVRIDKWLWAVRIFKTRSLAAEACEKSKVLVNEISAKPSRNLKPGDKIAVQSGSLTRLFEVLTMQSQRVSAKDVAIHCKETTPEEEILKHQALQKAAAMWRDRGAGRPTKKERRELDDFTWEGKFNEF